MGKKMDRPVKKNKNDKRRVGDFMPPVAIIEREREQYYQGMKEYLYQLKRMSPEEAKAEAKESLFNSGIIDEQGNLAERYRYTKKNNK